MLDGIRILDLTGEPGYLAGKILGDAGADVIKIEPPGGDVAGRRGPYLSRSGDSSQEDLERSLPWLALNTSKRGITLDPAVREGRDLFRSLAARADVVLETGAPGALDELGIGFASLHAELPRLIYCAITPFGQTGPCARYRAHDLVIVAMGGNASLTGDADRPPVRCSLPTAYLHAGPEAATGIAMALWARESSGRGQQVDVSMHETQLSTLVTNAAQYARHGQKRGRTGDRLGKTREIWKTRDGDVTFGLRGGAARIPNLIAIVEYMAEEGLAPEWLRKYDWSGYDPNGVSAEELDRLERAFAEFFATRTRRELYDRALRDGIMLAPCNDARAVLEQPQLRARELFTTLEYPELGASIEHPDFFAKCSAGQIGIRRRAPRIGEHNAEVYGELGLAASDLAELSERRIV